MNWKRVVCFFLRHKWEYMGKPEWKGGRTRGCLRCDKREAQMSELRLKYPDYWHHIGYEWISFKESQKKWEARRKGSMHIS